MKMNFPIHEFPTGERIRLDKISYIGRLIQTEKYYSILVIVDSIQIKIDFEMHYPTGNTPQVARKNNERSLELSRTRLENFLKSYNNYLKEEK